MTTTKTTTDAGVPILALRPFTAPLATPLDALGLPRADVLDRGQEATVTTEWYEQHQTSGAYVAADSPEADAARGEIEIERRIAVEASYAHRMRQASTADARAALRIQEQQQLAAEARSAMAATTAGSAA